MPNDHVRAFPARDEPCASRNELWLMKNRVAAYHIQTGTGILAYYDGLVLDESDVLTRAELNYDRNQVPSWRPGRRAGLPIWPLANKQVRGEGLAQFNRNAHWNVWPIANYNPESATTQLLPSQEPIMSPAHAKSLSIARLSSRRSLNLQYIYQNHSRSVHAAISANARRTLRDLVQCLGTSLQVRTLKLSLGIPQMPIRRDPTLGLVADVRFPFHDLISACKQLRALEVELFHFHDYRDHNADFLDNELLDQFRLKFISAMGGSVTETMTATASRVTEVYNTFNGRRLLDRKLVYTKG